jgi:orotidine-5'-phosphate decarboxylase
MLTLHLSGGRAMIEAAARSAAEGMLLLGVTVLTSSDEATLRETGVNSSMQEQVLRLAQLGVEGGITGLVASPHELGPLRSAHGAKIKIVTPGIRPSGSATGDQKRVTTPAEALRAGADFLVIGRPITAAPDPRGALDQILADVV